ncbi:aldose 1-epimerase [Pseudomonas sp. M30-35]|uniref:aldose 1-epimerase n=1 Tax=Pseudomonas sp. M30-35 TaxID=1981174 RepID=UPI000B3C46E3|nr:aldose 1-epimerase [Pseudomonas sp. M30-35]ARU89937.1 aldose epimerase [Pseudomonas sp. M30-35]
MPASLLHLEDRLTCLSLIPAVGGSIANWSSKQTGQPLLRPSDQQALNSGSPRRLACYPLAPWSNRIAEGGFECPDGWLALSPNTDHDAYPIHGSAWQQAWHVAEHSSSHAHLTLNSNQPFAYRAEQHIELRDGRLSIRMRVTHLDAHPAWHGIGLHPYLPRTPQTQLCAAAQTVWKASDDKLPNTQCAIPPDWNFSQLKPLPDELVDHAFGGWDGTCLITQADAGYQLACQVSGADYFLLYCPVGSDFFCFEPVSHPINAHHLPGKPGLRLLQQGQSTELEFSLHYQPLTQAEGGD